MKKVLKRNQILITALAIMIAVAGYLNFAGKNLNKDEMASVGSDSVSNDEYLMSDGIILDDLGNNITYDELSLADPSSGETVDIQSLDVDGSITTEDYLAEGMEDVTGLEGVKIGEIPGEAVLASTGTVSSLSGAKLLKEQTRAKNKETLLQIINNGNIDNAQKQTAIDNMIRLTDIAEREAATEILLDAKGFAGSVVSISGTYVDVFINAVSLNEAERAQIEDIVRRKTELSPEKYYYYADRGRMNRILKYRYKRFKLHDTER